MKEKSKRIMGGIIMLMVITAYGFVAWAGSSPKQAGKNTLNGYDVSGPYVHENLSVFLIHGKDSVKGKTFLTIEEALDKGIAVLHETGSVGRLVVENNDKEHHIYIQSGDIVKGGKQDRVIALDIIVPPRSGKVSLDSFCVEAGRWNNRGNESVSKFSSSKEQLNSKDLKLAAKAKRSQGKVWEEVAKSQKELGDKLGQSVKSGTSETSLQLTLENKDVKKAAAAYVSKLEPVISGQKDVVGFAFAVNGEFNSADIYGSGALFKKLWPKLIKASAVEAVSLHEKGKTYAPVSFKDIKNSLADAKKGSQSEKTVGKGVKIITRESKRNIMFDTMDNNEANMPENIHTNIIRK